MIAEGNVRLTVTVNKIIADKIKQKAKKRYMTVSEYVKELFLKDLTNKE